MVGEKRAEALGRENRNCHRKAERAYLRKADFRFPRIAGNFEGNVNGYAVQIPADTCDSGTRTFGCASAEEIGRIIRNDGSSPLLH